ncbi:unnamed protein product [Spirodela intermedia]|uniref:Uncharacterized protein n=1 Tax=Spirodela intermedia TaxID=51605 RepID=A0A7I8J470_SPIIN|nr:unnamed protein product [Spirodela intermedia]CAA6665056.1 unnamed protein product [Spirodela intermedia]
MQPRRAPFSVFSLHHLPCYIPTLSPTPSHNGGEGPPPPPPPPPLPSPPQSNGQTSRVSSTYIVQVPKDQIYRVPAPEIAYLAERYQKPRGGEQVSRPWFTCVSRCLVVLFIVVLSLVVAVAVFYLVVRPAFPPSLSRASTPSTPAAMTDTEPSVHMGLSYERGGTAVLSNSNGNIATGKTPSFYQSSGEMRIIFLDFSGPVQVNKSFYSPRTKVGVSLSLSLKFPMRMKVGTVESMAIEVDVWCSFSLSSLVKESKVMRQSCYFDP